MQITKWSAPFSADKGSFADRKARVCVIGAGCSGLVSIKALLEAGHHPQGFEMGSDVGGLWVLDNDSGRSAAYNSLRINTSRKAMAFSDFPMPKSYGDFALHHQVANYLRAYATQFQLRPFIRLSTEVTRCFPLPEGGYRVCSRERESGKHFEENFDAVIVANGHHWLPTFPDPPPAGTFTGQVIHSHDYRNPDRPLSLRGKRVLVVGMGNSAMDIASELAKPEGAARVLLSGRRGAWVIPRYLLGRPVDQGTLVPTWLPPKLRRRIVTLAFTKLVGKMSDFGLPEPDHLIGEAHPTLSSELPELVKSGAIQMRGAIAHLDGSKVIFDDQNAEDLDAIIYCTGYQVRFPFLDESHVRVEENDLPLYRRVFHPTHRHLFFVGLAQPLGAIMPIAELQAQWIAEHLAGRYNLPNPKHIETEITKERQALQNRYVASKRHTMQLDPIEYRREVHRERKRGRVRARHRSGLPFPLTLRSS